MPRRPRFIAPDIPHHITQRGNNRQNVFFSDHHRRRYLEILHHHASRHHLRVLAWCLMTNHVHLIAIPADAKSLSLALGQAHSQYSLEINRARRRTGHLWQNRFSSCPLDSSHLLTAMRYVELNPLRAGMVAAACDWPWSSAKAHTVRDANDPLLDWPWQPWMQQARLGTWNCEDWNASLKSTLPERELEMIRRAARLGEPLGSPAFLAGLERQTGRRLRVLPAGRPAKQGIAAGASKAL